MSNCCLLCSHFWHLYLEILAIVKLRPQGLFSWSRMRRSKQIEVSLGSINFSCQSRAWRWLLCRTGLSWPTSYDCFWKSLLEVKTSPQRLLSVIGPKAGDRKKLKIQYFHTLSILYYSMTLTNTSYIIPYRKLNRSADQFTRRMDRTAYFFNTSFGFLNQMFSDLFELFACKS